MLREAAAHLLDPAPLLPARKPLLPMQESELAAMCAMPGVLAAIYTWDAERGDFQARFWNEALCALYGTTQATVRGTWFGESGLSETTRARWVHFARECMRTGESYSCEYPSEHAEGRWYSATLARVHRDDGAPMFAWLAVDITERKQLTEQFLHAQKLEAMGRLAGGIAHDFSSLLTVIAVSVDMMAQRGPRDAEEQEDIAQIQAAVTRASALSRQLLSFARRRSEAAQRVDAAAAVRASEEMLSRLLGAHVELVVDAGDEEAPIHIDLQQLDQVLANLVVNARDAMPEGGTITLRTAVRHDADAGRVVEISVSDTGEGIAPAHRDRIFEPFFTTKPEGVGTGLGLSTVAGIVQHAGGRVAVASEVGEGSTFTLTFPWDGEEGEEEPDIGSAGWGPAEVLAHAG
jgi:PAS domain S-box-containing protein